MRAHRIITSIAIGLVIGAASLAAAPALAHHTSDAMPLRDGAPANVASVAVSGARFDFDDAHGSAIAMVTSLELAPVEWASVAAHVPIAVLAFDDGTSAAGLGDAEVAGKVRAFAGRRSRLALDAGVALELPTGDVARHLGGGHVELAPFATVVTTPIDRLILTSTLADHVSIEPSGASREHDDDGAHGSVLAPHSDHEATLRVIASTLLADVSVGAGVDATYVVTNGVTDGVAGPFLVLARVAWLASPRLTVALDADASIGREVRTPWAGRASIAWRFD